MKKIVGLLFAASFGACTMVAVADKSTAVNNHEYGSSMSQLLLHERSIVSGLVIETERGIAVTTNRGTLLLKGLHTREPVGRKVRITGVIRGDSLFAVKVELRS